MKSKLIKHALDTYKISPLSSWVLGLVTGLLITDLLALDLVAPYVCILSFPLLMLPIIFSSTLQHLLLKTPAQTTVKSSIRGFGLYFTRPYRGSFQFFFSLFKAVAVFLIAEMTLSFTLSTIFQYTNAEFSMAVQSLYDAIYSSETSMNEIMETLFANEGILFAYISIIMFVPLYIALIVFIYNLSRSSIIVYFQMQHPMINSRFSRFVYLDILRYKRFNMLKDYWTLNWPLYVLLALGFAGGTVGGYFLWHDLAYMLAFGLMGGALLATFFLPFYFGNQEALYDFYADQFEASSKRVTSYMINNIQRNIDLSEEEKAKLQDAFKGEDDKASEEDSNKKDPNGPQ